MKGWPFFRIACAFRNSIFIFSSSADFMRTRDFTATLSSEAIFTHLVDMLLIWPTDISWSFIVRLWNCLYQPQTKPPLTFSPPYLLQSSQYIISLCLGYIPAILSLISTRRWIVFSFSLFPLAFHCQVFSFVLTLWVLLCLLCGTT